MMNDKISTEDSDKMYWSEPREINYEGESAVSFMVNGKMVDLYDGDTINSFTGEVTRANDKSQA